MRARMEKSTTAYGERAAPPQDMVYPEIVLEDMKATRKQTVWSVGLLLVAACAANAMPPVPHRINGGIERIDGEHGEVVITNASERVTLTWKDSARLEKRA
jgi:hypothetical protein